MVQDHRWTDLSWSGCQQVGAFGDESMPSNLGDVGRCQGRVDTRSSPSDAVVRQPGYNTPTQNRGSGMGGRRQAMYDPFEKKVRAAAVAGWWVILIGYALLTVTWVVYLVLVSARPAWMLAMWGPNVSWDFMQVVSLWFMGVLKLFIWILVLIALWLTLWARQLRKMDRA